MPVETEYPRRLPVVVAILAATLASILVSFAPGFGILPVDIGDGFLLVFLALHGALAATLMVRDARVRIPWAMLARAGELLLFAGLFLLLFGYIYAANAGMDYAQRFAQSGGLIQLASDTRTQRLAAIGRYAPLMVLDLVLWLLGRRHLLFRRWRRREGGPERVVGPLGSLAVVVSAILTVLAQPSGLNVDGLAPLAWFALVPLFVVVRTAVLRGRSARAVGSLTLFGVLATLLGNFWLGTFSLISLQVVGVIFLGWYLLFGLLVTLVLRVAPRGPLRGLVLPFAWTAFEFARSSGFIGYPWLLTAHSQYQVTPLIQIAEYGGVWLVSLIVLLVNGALAEAVIASAPHSDTPVQRRLLLRKARLTPLSRMVGRLHIARGAPWLIAAVAIGVGALALGAATGARPVDSNRDVRVALIQQNTDPRKSDYQRTFATLTALTDRALADEPDLVVWSETAFVPNLRRWSQEDPERHSLARLARQFLAYQEGIDTWLLTGNDDYRRVLDADGVETERLNFNATVLYSDDGERVDTYHKIKLVPFTEYFPYERWFGWVRELLLAFDVYFWHPGDERVIFEHPQMRFATPICFEDVFPGEVRAFAQAGMEVIVNVSNDYWSLQEVAAQQHFAAALFRTVELRRPMVRATASGVTAHVDAYGNIRATRPQYSEQILVADVAIPTLSRTTLYERWGDWVPWTAGLLTLVVGLMGLVVGWAFGSEDDSEA